MFSKIDTILIFLLNVKGDLCRMIVFAGGLHYWSSIISAGLRKSDQKKERRPLRIPPPVALQRSYGVDIWTYHSKSVQ